MTTPLGSRHNSGVTYPDGLPAGCMVPLECADILTRPRTGPARYMPLYVNGEYAGEILADDAATAARGVEADLSEYTKSDVRVEVRP